MNKIDVVVSGKTDGELMAVLVAAFRQHAAEVADAENWTSSPTHAARGRCKRHWPIPVAKWRHDRGSARSYKPQR